MGLVRLRFIWSRVGRSLRQICVRFASGVAGEVKQAVEGHLAKGFGIVAIGQFCDKICG